MLKKPRSFFTLSCTAIFGAFAQCGDDSATKLCQPHDLIQLCADGWCVDTSVPEQAWRASFLPLNSVWSSSASDIWMVGESGLMIHSDGCGYQRVDSGTSNRLYRVNGTSASDIWAIGDQVATHFDGTKWSAITSPGDTSFKGIWGVAENDYWALGQADGSIFHWDGTSWTAQAKSLRHPIR